MLQQAVPKMLHLQGLPGRHQLGGKRGGGVHLAMFQLHGRTFACWEAEYHIAVGT